MKRPLIGITTYGCDNEHKRYHLPANYIAAINIAGGIPVMIAPEVENAADYLSSLSGLMLVGGGDIDPELYRGLAHHTVSCVNQKRDQSEIKLAEYAIEKAIPILAICRGLQLINVMLGGRLHEHLPDFYGDQVPHYIHDHESVIHEVNVQSNSKLAEILGKNNIQISSRHHQAIQHLAEGLVAVAHAEDGLIEAIEMPAHPFLIGVQWHPEVTSNQDETQQRLFSAFVQAARLHRK